MPKACHPPSSTTTALCVCSSAGVCSLLVYVSMGLCIGVARKACACVCELAVVIEVEPAQSQLPDQKLEKSALANLPCERKDALC